MVNETHYRLGNYRITEYGKNLLWWETHVALGEQRSGRSFIRGDVLIIGHASNQDTGYLIGEFLEQLEKFPPWTRTRYYCFASELLDVVTGQGLTNDLLERRLSPGNDSSDVRSGSGMKAGEFRLAEYHISVTANGEVAWQTHRGPNRIIGGRCVIESGMLFIGSQEYDEELTREEFLGILHHLPQWDKTPAWARNLVLRDCRQQHAKRVCVAHSPGAGAHFSSPEKGSSTSPNRHGETCRKLLQSCIRWLRTFWGRIREGKAFLKYLIPLVAAGMLVGLAVTLHSGKKKFHWSHWFKDHHHEHDHAHDHR